MSAVTPPTASTSTRCRLRGRRYPRPSTRSWSARGPAHPPAPTSTVRPGESTATVMVLAGAMSAPPNSNPDGNGPTSIAGVSWRLAAEGTQIDVVEVTSRRVGGEIVGESYYHDGRA